MIAHVLAAALVAHSHLVSAFAAIGDAVEQRCAIAWDSTALDVLVFRTIVAQHRLDLLESLPIDINRVFVPHHDPPVRPTARRFLLTLSRYLGWFLPSPSIDKGGCIGRILEDRYHSRYGCRLPAQIAMTAAPMQGPGAAHESSP